VLVINFVSASGFCCQIYAYKGQECCSAGYTDSLVSSVTEKYGEMLHFDNTNNTVFNTTYVNQM